MPANYFESDIDLGLPAVPKSPLPEMQGELEAIYFAIRKLQAAFTDLCGVSSRENSLWTQLTPVDTLRAANLNRLYVQASEAVPFGAIINLHLSGGVLKVRNARRTWNADIGAGSNISEPATVDFPPHGFCNTVGGIASGEFGEVVLGQGLNQGVSGLTVGSPYFLADTGLGVGFGKVSTVARRSIISAGGAGTYVPCYFVGVAVSATALWVNVGTPIVTVSDKII